MKARRVNRDKQLKLIMEYRTIKENESFKYIAKRLGKSPSTVSREVRNYLSEVATGHPGFPFNVCKNRLNCRVKKVCGRDCIRTSTQYCKLCRDCNLHCPDFIEEVCTARFRVPYVCNGCETIGKCSLMKNIYDAEHAHIKFHKVISESRSGLCVSEEEVPRLNSIICPLVDQGQSVHQIYATHSDDLMCNEKTIYNYIDACLFDVRNIDLPRKVKFCERYKNRSSKLIKAATSDVIIRNSKNLWKNIWIQQWYRWTLLSEPEAVNVFLPFIL